MGIILVFIYCRHKFVLAYLPVIAFYHWGKVIYKFDLEDSYEEMMDQLVKMTGKVQRTSSRFLYSHYDYENNTIQHIKKYDIVDGACIPYFF